MRGLKIAAGVLIIALSAFFVVSATVELAQGNSKTEPGVLLGLIVFFLGTGAAGAMLAWSSYRKRPTARVDPEQCILGLAEERKGRLTAPEVAAHCSLSLDHSKQQLDRLTVNKVAHLQATDDGILVYYFPGFLSSREKEAAKEL